MGGFYVFPGGTVLDSDYSLQVLERCRGLSGEQGRGVCARILKGRRAVEFAGQFLESFREAADARLQVHFGHAESWRSEGRDRLAGAAAEDRLRESFGSGEERAVALAAACRKWKALQTEPDPRKRVQRLQRFLYSRGFSEAIIYEVSAELDALST